MKKFLISNWAIIAGVLGGGVLGYLYWYFVGCGTGTCPLTSTPINSTISGALIGGLLFSSNKKRKDDKSKN